MRINGDHRACNGWLVVCKVLIMPTYHCGTQSYGTTAGDCGLCQSRMHVRSRSLVAKQESCHMSCRSSQTTCTGKKTAQFASNDKAMFAGRLWKDPQDETVSSREPPALAVHTSQWHQDGGHPPTVHDALLNKCSRTLWIFRSRTNLVVL